MAEYSEQGCSTATFQPIKIMDTVSCFTKEMGVVDCGGCDADATAAYTQVELKDADDLLGPGEVSETWVKLPKDQWLPGWEKFKEPG